jgi:phosphoesterase RecJ-like protein
MAVPVPPDLLDFIKQKNKFLVAGHKEPDGDCVGSQLALVSTLRRMGKDAIPCSAGPFKRTEVKAFERYFTAAPGETEQKDAGLLIVDCGSPDRTGDLESFIRGLPTAIIDHHAGSRYAESKNPALSFIDGDAPSVTFMVLELVEALGLTPTREEAELLLFGLCTDTGFFRHVDGRGAQTFEAAARMIRAGANPKKAFRDIYGGKSLDSRILMGSILSRAEAHFGGRLILSTEEYEESQRYGLAGRDSDMVYQALQSIDGMEAIVIIRQEKPGNCTVGFRSRDDVDVAAVAKCFGGGGHKNAAGASIPGTIPEIKAKILARFNTIF